MFIMSKSAILLVLSGVLLGGVVMGADLAHQKLIEACVCVVNSSARAAVALAFTAAIGAGVGVVPMTSARAVKYLELIQVLSFIIALFYLVQHVFFVLQLA